MSTRPPRIFGDDDLFLFHEGSHLRLWERFGAHVGEHQGEPGTRFAVWAPNAREVSVIGDWNGWKPGTDRLHVHGGSGVWEGFVPRVGRGAPYKYHVVSRRGGFRADKADPFAFHAQVSPDTASVVWPLDYEWGDAEWLQRRAAGDGLAEPMSIYELHVGSWRRVPEERWRSLSYRELAPRLADYAHEMGFTHVELMPVMEHPFFGSWGYQTTGYFAASSRYGAPQDLMHLIDLLHQRGIGVILDWVPSHFPTDGHGLGYFDGTHLYEHADPRQGIHPDWNSFVFNYGRHEVRSFLLSSALFWLEVFHADGLRVDAVASMLYLDYSRKEGEWIPNERGGRENLPAIEFLRRMNTEIYGRVPGAQTIAEESTAWPRVSRPTGVGGLGFGMKWDMGWMHDTLQYMRMDPLHRAHHHDRITFRGLYAFDENFVLPLSHDEVVHGKGSLLSKMPGDEWQKFANLRVLLGMMWAQPGKKLLFMGGEFGQWSEWNHDGALAWDLLERPRHQGLQRWVRDLNTVYRAEPALHAFDCDPRGFAWVAADDRARSTLAWLRRGADERDVVLVACNLTPVPRANFRLGVPRAGAWREILNADARLYGGSGQGNLGGVVSHPVGAHGQPQSINVTLPPLAVVFFKPGEP